MSTLDILCRCGGGSTVSHGTTPSKVFITCLSDPPVILPLWPLNRQFSYCISPAVSLTERHLDSKWATPSDSREKKSIFWKSESHFFIWNQSVTQWKKLCFVQFVWLDYQTNLLEGNKSLWNTRSRCSLNSHTANVVEMGQCLVSGVVTVLDGLYLHYPPWHWLHVCSASHCIVCLNQLSHQDAPLYSQMTPRLCLAADISAVCQKSLLWHHRVITMVIPWHSGVQTDLECFF